MAHAGIGPDDVDAILLGHFNAGFSAQDFTAASCCRPTTGSASSRRRAWRMPAPPARRRCARVSARSCGAAQDRAGGRRRADDATPGPEIGRNLLRASYLPEDGDTAAGFAGIFGNIAQAYFQRYGDHSDALAMIAAKNHRNGVDNPYAQMRKDLAYDFCRHESEKNPFVAGPLKRTDCSLVSDGAAALVLADIGTGSACAGPCHPRDGHVQDFLPMSKRDILHFEGCAEAGRGADAAGVTLDDLSFVETHDCFTIAELIEYEAMGLTKRGEGGGIAHGRPDGEGRQAAGQSVGRAEGQGPSDRRYRRLHARDDRHAAHRRGRWHADQSAKLAGIFNMGGAAVANYVSILEPDQVRHLVIVTAALPALGGCSTMAGLVAVIGTPMPMRSVPPKAPSPTRPAIFLEADITDEDDLAAAFDEVVDGRD